MQTSVYDPDNNLIEGEQTGDGATLVVDFTYTPDNQIATELTYSNLAGTTKIGETDYLYNKDGNVTSEVSTNGTGTDLESFTYTYDLGDRVTAQTRTDYTSGVGSSTTTSYTYDGDSELTSAGGITETYDADGNRDGSGYVVGAGNEILNDGTYSYTYDAEGDRIGKSDASGDSWTYAYDNAGQLTQVRQFLDGSLVSEVDYQYDVYGNLLVRTAWEPNGLGVLQVVDEEEFGYDGWKTNLDSQGDAPSLTGQENWDAWAVLNSSNTLTTRTIFGNSIDFTIAEFAPVTDGPTAESLYITDYQGSIVAMESAAGALQGTIVYNGFGVETSNTIAGGEFSYGFQGQKLDGLTNLGYANARWTDPNTGAFTSMDRTGFASGTTNLDAFAGNDPRNASDPSGDWFFSKANDTERKYVNWLKQQYGVTAEYHRPGKADYSWIEIVNTPENRLKFWNFVSTQYESSNLEYKLKIFAAGFEDLGKQNIEVNISKFDKDFDDTSKYETTVLWSHIPSELTALEPIRVGQVYGPADYYYDGKFPGGAPDPIGDTVGAVWRTYQLLLDGYNARNLDHKIQNPHLDRLLKGEIDPWQAWLLSTVDALGTVPVATAGVKVAGGTIKVVTREGKKFIVFVKGGKATIEVPYNSPRSPASAHWPEPPAHIERHAEQLTKRFNLPGKDVKTGTERVLKAGKGERLPLDESDVMALAEWQQREISVSVVQLKDGSTRQVIGYGSQLEGTPLLTQAAVTERFGEGATLISNIHTHPGGVLRPSNQDLWIALEDTIGTEIIARNPVNAETVIRNQISQKRAAELILNRMRASPTGPEGALMKIDPAKLTVAQRNLLERVLGYLPPELKAP